MMAFNVFFVEMFAACSYKPCWGNLFYFSNVKSPRCWLCYLLQNGGFSKTGVSEVFWHISMFWYIVVAGSW